MVMGTGNFAEELWPGILDHFQHTYEEYKPIWPQLYRIIKSSKAFEKIQGIVGTPMAREKSQGEPTDFVDPLQGYQKEIVNIAYSLGSGITKELYDDEQYGIINDLPRFLARSMRHTEEVTHHAPFNNATTTALSADGVSVGNATHPMIGVTSTLSNVGQSGVTYALSQTTLEQAVNFISRWTDDAGLRINIGVSKLLVPTELRFTAQKILNTEFEVGTANNTINPVRGMFPVVVSPFLTDTDGWFLLTDVNSDAGQKGFIHLEREAADMQRDSDFTTRNMLFSTFARWGLGVADFRSVWVSTGA